ncbi:MAG: hypothetical protein IPG70_04720 [Moraxellaceae bacterium]|nr:hypothetical protein [Moraxellaceae bacterium]
MWRKGLGKTHLMQAVSHALLAKKHNARVLYSTSESLWVVLFRHYNAERLMILKNHVEI